MTGSAGYCWSAHDAWHMTFVVMCIIFRNVCMCIVQWLHKVAVLARSVTWLLGHLALFCFWRLLPFRACQLLGRVACFAALLTLCLSRESLLSVWHVTWLVICGRVVGPLINFRVISSVCYLTVWHVTSEWLVVAVLLRTSHIMGGV